MGESVVVVVVVCGSGVVVDAAVVETRDGAGRRLQHVLLVERVAPHRRRTRPLGVISGHVTNVSLGRRVRRVSPLIIGRLSFALRRGNGGRGA